MALDLTGVYPPIPTSFNDDETLNEGKLAENLKKWEAFQFRGYVILGSNGEFPYLTFNEKISIAKHVRENTSAEKLIIAGAGCESTKETIDLCNELYYAGVNAALIHTPHFYRSKMTCEALINHYKKVADKSKLPVILYNVPSNTGVELNFDTVKCLMSHANIIGLKDSGGDIDQISCIVKAAAGENFQVLAGSAGFLADAMEQGCVGGICALANVLPKQTLMLFDLMKRREVTEAKKLQAQLYEANAAVTRKYGVPALKYVLDRLGYYGGPTRNPLLPLNVKEKATVDKAFRDAGVHCL